MSKTVHVSIRADASLKREVDIILKKLGLSPSEVINIFYHQIKLNNGLPFKIKIPNKGTKKAIEDLKNNINVTQYNNVDEMCKDLGI